MPVTVTVWNTHDNTFKLLIKEGDVPVDLDATAVSRMVIITGPPSNQVLDSDDLGLGAAGQPIDWTSDGANGVVELDFGDQGLEVGVHYCTLVIYDPAHTNGQVWGTGDDFILIVKPSQVSS
jgi:hypothetical protein